MPATARPQGHYRLGDRVEVVFAGQHYGLGSLHQQSAQVTIASLGDGSEVEFASAGILSGRQPKPGGKLCTLPKLLEVADHR